MILFCKLSTLFPSAVKEIVSGIILGVICGARRVDGTVTWRSAKPFKWVRLPYVPPLKIWASGGIGIRGGLKIRWP